MKTNPQNRKPSVAIVGFGRLGQALSIALQAAGYPISAVVTRHAPRAKKATLLGERGKFAVALGTEQLEQLPLSKLVIIATPDDVIEVMAKRLAESSQETRGRTVLHTSGALSSEALSPLKEVGFYTGSLHPLVSVSEARAGANALRGAFYCLEGDPAAKRVARLIVKDLKGTSFSIQPEKKALYHAAAVMASGHLVALVDLATEMLTVGGLSKQNAARILLPLIQSTLNNLKTSSPERALTGTFARGDFATVQRHLKALSRKELAAALQIYKLLGLRSLQLAHNNKLNSHLVHEIKSALDALN